MRTTPNASEIAPTRHLVIELLAIDLATCGRCTRTDTNLDSALRTAATRLREEGVNVEVRKIVVQTAERAELLRFESSPTIRVDGQDIALELRESACEDCGSLCGGKDGVDCRVWVWQGREYLEAPEPMIVEAVLRAYRDATMSSRPSPATPFRLPDNLRRFFEAKAKAGMASPVGGNESGCCGTSTGSCCGT